MAQDGTNNELGVSHEAKETGSPIRIARIATVSMFFNAHQKSQLEYLDKKGIRISIITSDPENLDVSGKYIRKYHVGIKRKPSLICDFIALIKLTVNLCSQRYDIVHSNTPKAGFLAVISARLCRYSVILHTFTGQPWATMKGLRRRLFKVLDTIIGHLATHCYADSKSQADFLINNKVVKPGKISVIGKGSVAGVDLEKYDCNSLSRSDKDELLKNIGIPEGSAILLFIGRITEEKGIYELIDSFTMLRRDGVKVELILVGPMEIADNERLQAKLSADGIHYIGHTESPNRYYAVSDILCLPSYREGFGSVIIEAAAMGVPAIGTNITGLVDAIVDGETGILVPTRDSYRLYEAIKRLINDDKLRIAMGENAHNRAKQYFDMNVMNDLMYMEYVKYYDH
jgi:glycosyltransferase involved in cell wall biosynthesis